MNQNELLLIIIIILKIYMIIGIDSYIFITKNYIIYHILHLIRYLRVIIILKK